MDLKNAYDDLMKHGKLLAKETSHTEFVEGVKTKEIAFEVLLTNKSKILKGSHKIIFNIYVLMYLLAPVIFLSILAYKHKNWFVLIGILISFLGSFLGAKKSNIPFLITMALLGWWAAGGFHFRSYSMLYLICIWWGYLWFQIADAGEDEYTKEALLNDPDLYKKLNENDLLFIMKKPTDIPKF